MPLPVGRWAAIVPTRLKAATARDLTCMMNNAYDASNDNFEMMMMREEECIFDIARIDKAKAIMR